MRDPEIVGFPSNEEPNMGATDVETPRSGPLNPKPKTLNPKP